MSGYRADGVVEQRTQELGRALLESASKYRPGAAERISDWLLTRAIAADRFRCPPHPTTDWT